MRHKRFIDATTAAIGIYTPEGESKEPTAFTGNAVVYNALSQPMPDKNGKMYRERFLPGAFRESLVKHDVIATVGHDPTKVLGRVSAGTLFIKDDDVSFRVNCPIAPLTYARDLLISIQRRDIAGMSFMFDDEDEYWTPRGKEGDLPICNIRKAEIREVCFCSDPAYLQTSASLRTYTESLQVANAGREIDPDTRVRYRRYGVKL